MTDPIHLIENDYPKGFPPALDEFPSPVNDVHYIDAWLLNTVFNSLLATEQYLIDYKGNIEAPTGSSTVSGRFTITGSKVFELQHQCGTTQVDLGFGAAANFATEVYSEVEFWKEF